MRRKPTNLAQCVFFSIINLMLNRKGESEWKTIIWLVLIVSGIIWWFNSTHPSAHFNGLEDYRDTWFTDTRTAMVLYCGKSPNIYCSPSGNWFTASVTWNGKERAASEDTEWIHYFTIRFPNGGWVETEATCDKAAEGWYSYKRFCTAYYYDTWGNTSEYLIVPYE